MKGINQLLRVLPNYLFYNEKQRIILCLIILCLKNKIKALNCIFGLRNSVKISLSELKKKKLRKKQKNI